MTRIQREQIVLSRIPLEITDIGAMCRMVRAELATPGFGHVPRRPTSRTSLTVPAGYNPVIARAR